MLVCLYMISQQYVEKLDQVMIFRLIYILHSSTTDGVVQNVERICICIIFIRLNVWLYRVNMFVISQTAKCWQQNP
jgi:hypothetical protein